MLKPRGIYGLYKGFFLNRGRQGRGGHNPYLFFNICLETVQQCNSPNCKLNIEFYLVSQRWEGSQAVWGKFQTFLYSIPNTIKLWFIFSLLSLPIGWMWHLWTTLWKEERELIATKEGDFFIHFMLSLKRIWVPQTGWGGAEGQWRQITKAWVSNNKEQDCRDVNYKYLSELVFRIWIQNTTEMFEIPPLLS